MAISQLDRSVWPWKPISLVQATRSVAARMISSQAAFASNRWHGRLASPVALAWRMRSSTRGVLAMTQFQPAELPGHHPGWCVGDKRGHPQPVGVGEPQLRSRMRAFLAQDEPGPDGPAAQIDQIGGLGDPGTLADAAAISSSYTSAWPPKQRSESNYAKHAAPWRRAETNQPSRADTMRQLCRGTPVNYVVKPDTRTGTQGVCAEEKTMGRFSFR